MTIPDSPSSHRIRVMVVDDHPAVQDALGNIIQGETGLELVGVVGTGAEALELAKEKPDVAVIDISLGDADGLVLLEQLQHEHRDLHVVVFSMHDEMIFGQRAILAGAASYLMKDEPTHRVLEAIRRVARGELFVSRKLAAKLLSRQMREGDIREPSSEDNEVKENPS